MLDVALQILSVLGIILLVLLGLLIAVILITLFFPVIYKVSGEGKVRDFSLEAKASWLFGMVRARLVFPDPGKLTVKVLWFTVFDSKEAGDDQEPHGSKRKNAVELGTHGKNRAESGEAKNGEKEKPRGQDGNRQQESPEGQGKGRGAQGAGAQETSEKREIGQGSPEVSRSEKLKKIKYTFCGICDKIKKIWQNITYYADLLQDRETRLLFLHVKSRAWKILKSIRPRKLRAQLLFGTGSPDMTGYAYGVYGMLLPLLGPDVIVTPDFCEAVFEGSFYAAGHITMAVLMWHTIRIFFDRRLKLFWDRLKTKGQDGNRKL